MFTCWKKEMWRGNYNISHISMFKSVWMKLIQLIYVLSSFCFLFFTKTWHKWVVANPWEPFVTSQKNIFVEPFPHGTYQVKPRSTIAARDVKEKRSGALKTTAKLWMFSYVWSSPIVEKKNHRNWCITLRLWPPEALYIPSEESQKYQEKVTGQERNILRPPPRNSPPTHESSAAHDGRKERPNPFLFH